MKVTLRSLLLLADISRRRPADFFMADEMAVRTAGALLHFVMRSLRKSDRWPPLDEELFRVFVFWDETEKYNNLSKGFQNVLCST